MKAERRTDRLVGRLTLLGMGDERSGPIPASCYRVILVLSGMAKAQVGPESFEVRGQSVVLCRPGEEVSLQPMGPGNLRYGWLAYIGKEGQEILRQMGNPYVLPLLDIASLQKTFEQIGRYDKDSYEGQLYRNAGLYQFMGRLLEAAKAEPAKEEDDASYVEAAVTLILSSYQEGIRVSDVARQIGISRNYLSTIFRQEKGLSPQEYLMNYRMERAAALLRSTREPISLIASQVGYGDSLSFSRAFRRRFGKSPSQYRRGASLTE